MAGRFELYKDVRGRFRFRLKSEEGEIILTSDGFDRKAFALDAIVSVMKSASEAIIVDLTLQEWQDLEPEEEFDLDTDDFYEYEEVDYEFSSDKKGKRRKKGKKGKKGKKASNREKKAKKRKKKRRGKKE